MIQLSLRFIWHLCFFLCLFVLLFLMEHMIYFYLTKHGNKRILCLNEVWMKHKCEIITFINNSFPHTQSHETLLILIRTRRICFIFLDRTSADLSDSFTALWPPVSFLVFGHISLLYVVTLKKKLPVFSYVSGSVQTVNVLVLPMFSRCGSCLLLDKISHLKQILIC